MEYLTVQETAGKWGLSPRTVQQLCSQGRVPGARKFGKSWAVPAGADKPADPRRSQEPVLAEPETLAGLNVMPLMNTPFRPGQCRAAVEAMEEGPLREIAWAEDHYFSGQPDQAAR